MILIASRKNETKHIGIGSQSSVQVTTVTVYTDNKNNLMYDKTTLIYD